MIGSDGGHSAADPLPVTHQCREALVVVWQSRGRIRGADEGAGVVLEQVLGGAAASVWATSRRRPPLGGPGIGPLGDFAPVPDVAHSCVLAARFLERAVAKPVTSFVGVAAGLEAPLGPPRDEGLDRLELGARELAGATVSRRESGCAVGIVRQFGDQAPLKPVAEAVVQAGQEAGRAVGGDD
jgi:hypothetical protein